MIQHIVRAQRQNILHWRHDFHHALRIQLQNAVQYRDLIISKRLLALSMELQERAQFGFLVCVFIMCAENII